jgi:hypothetical protein
VRLEFGRKLRYQNLLFQRQQGIENMQQENISRQAGKASILLLLSLNVHSCPEGQLSGKFDFYFLVCQPKCVCFPTNAMRFEVGELSFICERDRS